MLQITFSKHFSKTKQNCQLICKLKLNRQMPDAFEALHVEKDLKAPQTHFELMKRIMIVYQKGLYTSRETEVKSKTTEMIKSKEYLLRIYSL